MSMSGPPVSNSELNVNGDASPSPLPQHDDDDDDEETPYSPESDSELASPSPYPDSNAPQDPAMELSRRKVAEARADSSNRVYRVYCDGVFDLFHLGHMRMLEQAKKALGNADKVYLLAGVCSDELVHTFKGKTVMDHMTRCDSVRHCKWVDHVCEDAPWVITDDFIDKYQIDFVAHDAIPYKDTSGSASQSSDVYGHIKARGMFLETQRTQGISTSDIIVDIVKEYDAFVERNLSRGITKEEMNVGRSWEVRAKFHEKQKKFKADVDESKKKYKELNEAIRAFIKEFNPISLNLMRRSKSARKSLHFTPGIYVKNLRENLPARSEGIVHHAVGLTKALASTLFTVLSYANPFSYRFKTPAKKD